MYHIYSTSKNNETKLYGQSDYTKEEYNNLVNYWNNLYLNRHIKPIK